MALFARKTILCALFLLLAGAAVGWWQHDALLGWHYFRQLSRADENGREVWIARLIALDAGIVPQSLRCLENTDHDRCADAEAVLTGLAKSWNDGRAGNLLGNLIAHWSSFSNSGKNTALAVARTLVGQVHDTPAQDRKADHGGNVVTHLAAELLKYAVQDVRYRRATLRLAATLEKAAPDEMADDFLHELTAKSLAAEDAEVRALALHLFLYPPLSEDFKLLTQALPRLRDSSSQVRRAALLAFGANSDLLSDDDLLPLLHDADAEVRRLCEVALRARGLPDEHIVLGRLISDARPAARLEVLHYLGQVRDLEPGVRLRRLCQDSAPAVRAAVRAAASQSRVDLTDQLRDMAHHDESPTVRQIAGYYTTTRRQ